MPASSIVEGTVFCRRAAAVIALASPLWAQPDEASEPKPSLSALLPLMPAFKAMKDRLDNDGQAAIELLLVNIERSALGAALVSSALTAKKQVLKI
jgi:hypothetical protein